MGEFEVGIHVRPHVRKYLLFRLSPGERLSDPLNQDLVAHIARVIGGGFLRVRSPYPPGDDRALSLLLFVFSQQQSVSPSQRRVKKLNYMLEELYRRHSHAWIDYLRMTLNVNVDTSIHKWRSHYSIREEDQAYETARRAYCRYQARKLQPAPDVI